MIDQVDALARPQLTVGETLGLEEVLARLADDQAQAVVVTAQRVPDGDSTEKLAVRQRQRIPDLGIVREAQPIAAPDDTLLKLAKAHLGALEVDDDSKARHGCTHALEDVFKLARRHVRRVQAEGCCARRRQARCQGEGSRAQSRNDPMTQANRASTATWP